MSGLVLRLKVKNSLEYLKVDAEHWEKVRTVGWYLNKENVVINRKGVSYEEFVGIGDGLKNMSGNVFDKRAKFLIPVGLDYVWSEYLGRFDLR